MSRTSRFPEYHESSLKSFGEHTETRCLRTRCLRTRCGNRITDHSAFALFPGSTLILADGRRIKVTDDSLKPRIDGSILQTGKCLYIILDGCIWNKHGDRMHSPAGSGHYFKIGQALSGCWTKTNWYDKGMLQLRR